ncbi:PC-esterase domain-containing protein 1A [Armadillidium nasatum]|uniref:PC-esterase domain-containing protein 1A n=1 Tax=Armadillidium nasatum TaxID=96803 RepID=A0A5N5T6C7_9CRUS|nr:PC-esterase domain-containing protein 1A [Armadillidium nasatum]
MILEANKFTQLLCEVFEIDLLDLHYYLRFQLHRRAVDGVHWENYAIRFITCLLLTHITTAFRAPLPGRIHSWYLENVIKKADEDCANAKVFTKEIKDLVKIKLLEMKKSRKKRKKHNRNICKRDKGAKKEAKET